MIAVEGGLSLERYMRLCLQHPEYGYYRRRQPLGKDGDFTTAPEINQIFGEMIGVFIGFHQQNFFSDKRLRLCELGPGRALLAADYMRVLEKLSAEARQAELYFFESDEALKKIQKQTLPQVEHVSILDSLPSEPIFFIANEFFDAFPICAIKQENGYEKEIFVTHADNGFTFTDKIIAASHKEDAYRETSPDAEKIFTNICDHIRRFGGALLLIDYGHTDQTQKFTFRGFQKHTVTDGLSAPGEQDLTYDVSFSDLFAKSQSVGCHAYGPLFQKDFLLSLGAQTRFETLKQNLAPEKISDFTAGFNKLIDPQEKGERFKCLLITAREEEFFPFPL